METPQQGLTAAPRELQIVGGHLALDFANTVDDPLGPAHHDHAATYTDIIDWSLRAGTVTDAQGSRLASTASRRSAEAAAVVARAGELRSALSDLFGGIVDGNGDRGERDPRVRAAGGHLEPTGTWLRLRPFVADAYAAALWEGGERRSGRFVWPDSDELAVVLHPIAFAAAELLASDDLDRIKRCARCPWLFLDNSKNHSRRWCTMSDCGKAVKMERYVARRAASRRQASSNTSTR